MPKKTILIIGANSFIAQRLYHFLGENYNFIKISHVANLKLNQFDIDYIKLNSEILQDVFAIINLAGENIGAKAWSAKRKAAILNSRLNTIDKLINILNNTRYRPMLLAASAVGIYPYNAKCNEFTPINYNEYSNFSQEITKKIELAYAKYDGKTIKLRFGVVLSSDGGALKQIIATLRFGFLTGISNSNWPFCWISSKDLCHAIEFILQHEEIEGVVNLVAPQSISYADLINVIKNSYKPFYTINLPQWLIKLLFGQMGDELLLNGQNVSPQKLIDNKFQFSHSNINSCINDIKNKLI
jgi:uncharacterized protein (TIGR01777 family)